MPTAQPVLPAPAPPPPPATPPAPALESPPPEGFVDLRTLDGLQFAIGYATDDNFTDAPLPGYGVPGAWLHEDAAQALAEVQADLRSQGLGLLIFDAYRPARASAAMVAWAARTHQEHLLKEGYVAGRSMHNTGLALDLTLIDLDTGQPLDMGTAWDTFTEAAHYKNAEWPASYNREILRTHMRAHGFRGYTKEWWHYHLPVDRTPPHIDVPYGCFEPPAGVWKRPRGWHKPGWQAPTAAAPAPATCWDDQTK